MYSPVPGARRRRSSVRPGIACRFHGGKSARSRPGSTPRSRARTCASAGLDARPTTLTERGPNAAEDAELLTAAAVALQSARAPAARAGRGVRRRRPRVVPGRRFGARCRAGPVESRIWTSPPTRAPSRCSRSCGRGPTPCGTPASSSAPSVSARAATAWRSPRSAPTPTTGCRAIPRCGSATASKTIWCAATSRSTRWRCASRPTGPVNSSIRSAVWRRCGPRCSTPRRRRRCPSATTRCGCCARRGSSPSSASPSRRGCWRRSRRWHRELARISVERVAVELDKMLLRRTTRWPASTCWCRPGWARWCCPRSAACRWPSTNTTSTRTSTSTR